MHTLCVLLEELVLNKPAGITHYTDLIIYVKDRPEHDVCYAIDVSKVERELGCKPEETFESGIRKTVEWYLHNREWWSRVLDSPYSSERLGTVQ